MAASRVPLGAVSTNVDGGAARGKGAKTIEQTYQKKTQLEHILLRPDTYSTCCAVRCCCDVGRWGVGGT